MTPPAANPSDGGGAALRRRPARIVAPLTEAHLFLLLALLIGVFSGLAVVCFRVAIDWTRLSLLGSALYPPASTVLAVPALAGLVVAVVALKLFPAVRGSGVNQTKAAVYIYDGHIPFRTVIGKFLTCSLAIGGGHSLGPEDPSLQIGAGLASAFGRRLGLSRDTLRLVAPVGAAAGLAAAFNSPITAVLFVIEEVIGTWSAGSLGAIVLAAISSVVVEQWFLGDEPLFRVPTYHLVHSSELVAYAALGIVGGLAALVFVKLVLYFRPRLRALPRWTWYGQPALAGLAIGAVGVWFPQVMGAGYTAVDLAMHDQYVWPTLAALAALKILTTSLSFVSGTPGGLFAPTLLIGAMLGGAVHGVESGLIPGHVGPTGAYALIGMGTLFAGILRAPMTSVFMIIEVSGNYSIVLPLMISNTIAYLLSRRFQRRAIFDVLSEQDGLTLPSIEEQREARVRRVEDAMRRPAPPVCAGSDGVADALDRAVAADARHVLVWLEPGGWVDLSVDTLRRFEADGQGGLALASVAGPAAPLPYVHPDQPLEAALRLIDERPLLPVVHRADIRRVEGAVTLDDILAAFRRPPA